MMEGDAGRFSRRHLLAQCIVGLTKIFGPSFKAHAAAQWRQAFCHTIEAIRLMCEFVPRNIAAGCGSEPDQAGAGRNFLTMARSHSMKSST